MSSSDQVAKNVELWKMKKLIKSLEAARGNGTSMISLIIPPKDQVSRIQRMLADEYGTASNIKSRVNRQSVLGAITSTQQRLKLYTRIPNNGLVVFCGTIMTAEGKEKKVSIDFEPFKPINTSLYLCDNKFHTEALMEMFDDDAKYGFIIMDGNGCLFGSLSGNTRDVIHKFTVDLPKKHGRGGQSSVRFARLRTEKRHNYVRKVAETSTQLFITNDRPNVAGLVLAGSADFKNELNLSELFDPRLQTIVIKIVDVSYGGENGFNQAIDLSQEALSNVKFIHEKQLLSRFNDEVALGSGKVCYGVDFTFKALDSGAVETLIIYENLDLYRVKSRHGTEERIAYVKEGVDVGGDEILEKDLLVEWFAEHYTEFGTLLEFVTNKSPEGAQYVRGFGGIGGILRWRLEEEVFDSVDNGGYLDDDDEDHIYDNYV